jgi:hypothetical protein
MILKTTGLFVSFQQLLQKYVSLTKADSTQSLGLTIVGGDGSKGIYVDQLVTGGLAHLDGRIRRGEDNYAEFIIENRNSR